MSSSQPFKLSGDPKRPQDVTSYKHPPKPDEPPADLRVIGSMMLGLAAMLLKISWFGWAGVLLLLQYLATFHWREFDLKSTMSASFFTVSGLVGAYISPQGGGAVYSSIKALFSRS